MAEVKLSERLEALMALCECTEDAERDHNAPDAECVFVAVKNRTRSLFRGSTPGEAVDAAIAAANGGGDG